MNPFLDLNVQDYVLVCMKDYNNQQVCICCTSQSSVLFRFSSCRHTGFLSTFLEPEVNLSNKYICIICHHMLKKIEIFKQQVEESTALIFDRVPILEVNKLHNFESTSIEIGSVVISEIEVKPEPTDSKSSEVEPVVSNITAGHSSSVNETEPVAESKKKRKMKNNCKLKGRFEIVILSSNEIKEEREGMAQCEEYLKLPYKCEDCIVGFEQELKLAKHIKRRHKMVENGFQCKICKLVSSNEFCYSQHTQSHIKRLECMVCKKRYSCVNSAVQHYDEEHAPPGPSIELGYTCQECGFTTTSNQSYRCHMEKHKKENSCDICGNVFTCNHELKVHMFTIHKKTSYVYTCEPCNISYRWRCGIEAHKCSEHNTTDRRVCEPSTPHNSNAEDLSTHSRHVGESSQTFVCEDCGANFAAMSSLETHRNWKHIEDQQESLY